MKTILKRMATSSLKEIKKAPSEPTNIYEKRIKIYELLKNNYCNESEERLYSLSMIWSNMKFYKCRYSVELEDKIFLIDPELKKFFENQINAVHPPNQ